MISLYSLYFDQRQEAAGPELTKISDFVINSRMLERKRNHRFRPFRHSNPVNHPTQASVEISAGAFLFPMPFYTYILISESLQHLYIGQTNNLEQRLARHNKGHVKSTRIKGPWFILFSISHPSRAQAMKLERKLKNLKSRKRLLLWIQAHKDDQTATLSPIFYDIWEQN